MRPTIPYIQSKFNEFNTRFFDSILPLIPIRLSNAKGFMGKLCYTRTRTTLFHKAQNTDFILRINTRFDLPEQQLEDTILHEMIHYYIAFLQRTDTSAHGILFRAEMERINRLGNRHITISHRLTPAQQQQALPPTTTKVVCIITLQDGRIAVKVVPKQVHAILNFHNAALRHFHITHIQWFLTKEPFFATYPSSTALRLYLIQDIQALQNALTQSRPILCDGYQIRLPHHHNNHLTW